MNMVQLATNRFAPAELEGKLVNLSEESSGTKLTIEHLNTIKNLSGGGALQAEVKYANPFTLINKAKMIFSANKMPTFPEKGHSIVRRLCAIPFDHTIENPDPTVESRLLEEVPGIISLLIRRIQANIKINNGAFKCHRGGVDAKDFQAKILRAGNPIAVWADDCIEEVTENRASTYLPIDLAYAEFRAWCDDNGHKHIENKQVFSNFIHATFIYKTAGQRAHLDNRRRVNGKQVRVFEGIRLKETV